VTFTAQYNPQDIRVDKPVPWIKAPTSTGDQPELQFRSAEGRTMTFELLFDTFKAGTDVHTAYLSNLLSLATMIDGNGSEDKKRRTRVKLQGRGSLTAWIAEGQSVVHVKEAVGHSDLRTTIAYMHLAREHLRALVGQPKGSARSQTA